MGEPKITANVAHANAWLVPHPQRRNGGLTSVTLYRRGNEVVVEIDDLDGLRVAIPASTLRIVADYEGPTHDL